MMSESLLVTFVLLALTVLAAAPAMGAEYSLVRCEGAAPEGTIEIEGVAAGAFNPGLWESDSLNWNFDDRAPVIMPKEGPLRNIYAPTIVPENDGWRIYYGAWDGVKTGNDRIYTAWTKDFAEFSDRHMVIDHGVYIHVCNCCAIRLPDGAYRMMCTAYPHKEGGLNRPSAFESVDGQTWNGGAPHVAAYEDLVQIEGYPNWDNADMNGMNAILYEDGMYRLYFGDFRNFSHTFRASSKDFRTFTFDGPTLAGSRAVNDVKRFDIGEDKWYLMALHMNGDQMWYSLSRDGMSFDKAHPLTKNQSEADRYMVAIGWVTDGKAVYGFLYGAGAVPQLNQNRIFAKWLQKRVVLQIATGNTIESARAFGPDKLRLQVPEGESTGKLRVFAEDGKTLLCESATMTISAGERYRLVAN